MRRGITSRGSSSAREMRRGMSEVWEWGILKYRRDLRKRLDAA